MSDYGRGLDINHLDTRLVNKLNYSGIADFHTLRVTTEHSNFFSVCCVFISRFLVMTSNSGNSSASVPNSLPPGSQLHRLSLRFTDSPTTLSELPLQLSAN
jgi:hypothetical protein